MDILVDQSDESVTFTMPGGQAVEITMINVSGEDVWLHNDVQEALLILKDEFNYLDSDKHCNLEKFYKKYKDTTC